MDRDETGPGDLVRRTDRAGPEPQMRHRRGSGLLRVVDEVALTPQRGRVTDDADRGLVAAHRAVRTQPVEHRPGHIVGLDVEGVVDREREVGHVVGDPDGEPAFRFVGVELVEDRLDHRGRELLRREPVPAADDARELRALASSERIDESGGHVEQQRLTGRAGLLGPVEHRDGAH